MDVKYTNEYLWMICSSMDIAHIYGCVFTYTLKVYVEYWYTRATLNMRVRGGIRVIRIHECTQWCVSTCMWMSVFKITYKCLGRYANNLVQWSVYECTQMYMNVYEGMWVYMSVYEFIWTYMDVYDNI